MLTPKELANKLINYRIKNNLYQKALGKEIGISIKTVVSLEKERKVTARIQAIVENFLKEKGEI